MDTDYDSRYEQAYCLKNGVGVDQDTSKAISIYKNLYHDKPNDEMVSLNLVELLLKRCNNGDVASAKKICLDSHNTSLKKQLIRILVHHEYSQENYNEAFKIASAIYKDQSDEESSLIYADLLFLKDSYSQEAIDICQKLARKGSIKATFRLKRIEIEKPIDIKSGKIPNRINFMILSSDEYVKYTKVLIKSIKTNCKSDSIRIYIINPYMTDYHRQLLKNDEDDRTKISIIKIDDEVIKSHKFPVGGGLWSSFSLCRLVPHLLLPDDVDRVISLGVDTTVDGSVDDLYSMELGNNVMAATMSGPEWRRHYLDNLPDNSIGLINGDFILFDVNKMRTENITWDYYAGMKPGATEESILPAYYKGRIQIVDTYVYNYRPDMTHQGIKQFGLLSRKPIIVQYLGYQKPWSFYHDENEMTDSKGYDINMDWERNNLHKIWWKYAEKCDNYYELLSNMKIQRATLSIHTSKIESRINKITDNPATKEGHLGRAFRDGINVPKNIERAEYWMRRASDKGIYWATCDLFDILWKKNNPGLYVEMYERIKKGADKGDYGCIARLARLYREGRGVEKNYEKAAELMRISSENGITWAKWELLDLLYKINSPKSLEELKKRAEENMNSTNEKLRSYSMKYIDMVNKRS